ncbi:hypothetical protein C0V70_07470 [Bacteriovorax stolpii]|uniref:Uncharacterized protein n=2 Tax=Bacteriovorax stolpii TaxID=960 RepID=A0A2K9NR13_BACTC|nr:hypothetical protein [Bacteriovorax stolpii]AUN97947.1 hypothetical protein C0V70_07470 [Bacteriovorax stolpii]TDP51780.1 hypothetical protein C8D79_3227 [Bacteriovorax stolpii]
MKKPKSIKMNYLSLVFFLLFTTSAWGDCPQFETALEKAMARVTSREAGKAGLEKAKAVNWAGPEATSYKLKYGQDLITNTNNRSFISMMEADKKLKRKDVLYFDVENAVQKKLNDTLIGDKAMVDSVNNSFLAKFQKNLQEHPEVAAKLEGQYKDYKGMRLRLALREGEGAAVWEKKLNDIYQKSVDEFATEFEKMGLSKMIAPRTDEVVDVRSWFLSGSGESALEANMAARGARTTAFKDGKSRTVSFKEQLAVMHKDVNSIEGLRKSLAGSSDLMKSGIMIKTASGEVIPSKDMIGVLRKIKPSDCADAAEYAAKIRGKVKTLFNSDISDKHIDDLTEYFKKVDSLSPPLFQRERVSINLGEAKNGIVSVDFTGVGVDNAYEQMRALSAVNYAQKDAKTLVQDAFGKIQTNVDGVTESMNASKRYFTLATKDAKNPSVVPKFSGDDGILMPTGDWSMGQKKDLLKTLSKAEDPSKFRVTYVRTVFDSGAVVPAAERSQRVVRAEGIEKAVREAVTGSGKISSEKAKKMIFAVDSIPSSKGGKFNLLIGGTKPTEDEKKLILQAFQKSLAAGEGEVAGDIIDAFN